RCRGAGTTGHALRAGGGARWRTPRGGGPAHAAPHRRLPGVRRGVGADAADEGAGAPQLRRPCTLGSARSEEHTSELQSRFDLVCRLLLEKKKDKQMKAACVAEYK